MVLDRAILCSMVGYGNLDGGTNHQRDGAMGGIGERQRFKDARCRVFPNYGFGQPRLRRKTMIGKEFRIINENKSVNDVHYGVRVPIPDIGTK